MTMGEYIKQLRIEKGLSRAKLGEMVGVERAAVSKWENGSVENIKRSTIKRLSDIFNVSPCALMCWDESEPESQQKAEIEIAACRLHEKCYGSKAYELVEFFTKLNNAGKARAIENISDLVQLSKYTKPDPAGEKKKMA